MLQCGKGGRAGYLCSLIHALLGVSATPGFVSNKNIPPSNMTEYLREEMRRAVRSSGQKPLIICGAGVSSRGRACRSCLDSRTELEQSLAQGRRNREISQARRPARAASRATCRYRRFPPTTTCRWLRLDSARAAGRPGPSRPSERSDGCRPAPAGAERHRAIGERAVVHPGSRVFTGRKPHCASRLARVSMIRMSGAGVPGLAFAENPMYTAACLKR